MQQLAQNPAILIVFGIFVGVFSGVMGLGGGSVMIPLMVLVMGLTQTQAHGMSLAVMIPPVTLPAVIGYYRRGALVKADVLMALYIAIGFACGSYFGALIATTIGKHQENLKLVFGFVLTYVAAYTVFSAIGKEHIARNVTLAAVVVAFCVGMYGFVKWQTMRG